MFDKTFIHSTRKNRWHILSKVFRSTARQLTQKVGSIRCGSSRIQNNYKIIRNLNIVIHIKPFDSWHQKLKRRLAAFIKNSFLHKNGNRIYKYLVLGWDWPYLVKEHSDSKNKYTEDDIIKMLEFLVDNIFVVFAEKVSQQIIGIPMGRNCAPLLADIFLYSYEAEFIQFVLSAGRKLLVSQFNFIYKYIDEILSINNPDFWKLSRSDVSPKLEIKDTTESKTSASYLDLLLSIDRGGQLCTFLYDKRDDFNFHISVLE